MGGRPAGMATDQGLSGRTLTPATLCAHAHRVSSGSAFSSCSMNSARLSSVVTMSGGMVGEASAASRLRTSCSCMPSSSSLQQLTKPAAKSSRAIEGLVCASAAHARSARLRRVWCEAGQWQVGGGKVHRVQAAAALQL